MKRVMRVVLFVSATAALVGCGTEMQGGATGEGDPGDAELSALVSRTVMWRSSDGTLKTREETVTRREQLAEFSARLGRTDTPVPGAGTVEATSAALNGTLNQVSCSDANGLWIFDATDFHGRQLCLLRDAANDPIALLYLSTVSRYLFATWDAAARSLWAGLDGGALKNCTSTSCSTTGNVVFDRWQQKTNLDPSTLHVAYLHN